MPASKPPYGVALAPGLPEALAACRLGFWAALATAAIGGVYVGVLGALLLTGRMVMPPSPAVQLFGGIVTLALAPLLVAVMAALHGCASPARRPWSLLALAFTVLFAAMVCINRFVQLTVVRPGAAGGRLAELRLFLPYDTGSVMFALEILGWGFFLSLAMLCASRVFSRGRDGSWLRGLCLAYGVLGLISAGGHALASPVTAVGFVAWGPVLDVLAILLCFYFRRVGRNDEKK